MDLSIIRKLSEKREGGLKKLASDIGMSEANLHRCINNNRIQASDLEQISILLNTDIYNFFDKVTIKNESHYDKNTRKPTSQFKDEIIELRAENNVLRELAGLKKKNEERNINAV